MAPPLPLPETALPENVAFTSRVAALAPVVNIAPPDDTATFPENAQRSIVKTPDRLRIAAPDEVAALSMNEQFLNATSEP